MLATVAAVTLLATGALAAPTGIEHTLSRRWEYSQYFNLEGHRGARGQMVESTLPAFAEGLKSGVRTLEMDMGLTADGKLIVWHDERLDPLKCKDTAPAFPDDPMFPYVQQKLAVANLTLAQIKTLDCGSSRLVGFPLALTAPGTKLSTLDEMFDFVECAIDEPVLFNIETKINPEKRNETRSPEDFVAAFTKVLNARGPELIDRVTHQSFDWRALIESKRVAPALRTSALCDDTTLWAYPEGETTGNLSVHGTGPSAWLAGIDIDSFNASTPAERAAQAAASIGADLLSPVGTSYASNVTDISQPGYIPFTTPESVKMAHDLGLEVAVWTVNYLNNVEYLVKNCSADGIITDYPEDVYKYLKQQGYKLPKQPNEKGVERIDKCLQKHVQLTSQ